MNTTCLLCYIVNSLHLAAAFTSHVRMHLTPALSSLCHFSEWPHLISTTLWCCCRHCYYYYLPMKELLLRQSTLLKALTRIGAQSLTPESIFSIIPTVCFCQVTVHLWPPLNKNLRITANLGCVSRDHRISRGDFGVSHLQKLNLFWELYWQLTVRENVFFPGFL